MKLSAQLTAGILLAAASSVLVSESVQAQSVSLNGTVDIAIKVPNVLVVSYINDITFNLATIDIIGFPSATNSFTGSCTGTGTTANCSLPNVNGLPTISGPITFNVNNLMAIFTNAGSASITIGSPALTFVNGAGSTQAASPVNITPSSFTTGLSLLPFTPSTSNTANLTFSVPLDFLLTGGNSFSTAGAGEPLSFTVAAP